MTLFQGRVFSADPSGFIFPYFHHSLRLPPSASITASETQSSGELFRSVVMWSAFQYDVRYSFGFGTTHYAVCIDLLVFSAVAPRW